MQNNLNPESTEIESQLSETVKRMNVKGFILDLDDTLIPTERHIRERIFEFGRIASESLKIDPCDFHEKFREVNHRYLRTHGVNRRIWQLTLAEIGELYGHDFNPHLPYLESFYEIVPQLFEGAEEFLELSKSIGMKLGLNTHGNYKWKNFQIEKLGIESYFDVIVVGDEDRQKSDFDWRMAAHCMELDPVNALIIGDNPDRDIWAGFEAGARHGILLPNPAKENHNEILPPGAIYVDGGIKDVAQAMIDYWG